MSFRVRGLYGRLETIRPPVPRLPRGIVNWKHPGWAAVRGACQGIERMAQGETKRHLQTLCWALSRLGQPEPFDRAGRPDETIITGRGIYIWHGGHWVPVAEPPPPTSIPSSGRRRSG